MVLARCPKCGTRRPRAMYRNGIAEKSHSGSKTALWRNNEKPSVISVACHPWAANIHGHNMTAMDTMDFHRYL